MYVWCDAAAYQQKATNIIYTPPGYSSNLVTAPLSYTARCFPLRFQQSITFATKHNSTDNFESLSTSIALDENVVKYQV